MSHGSGGKRSHDLIRNLFFSYFDNEILNAGSDSAILQVPAEHLAFTTDSFVVDPLFFPGGDIGKLAVCGTVNDLAVSGAIPKYLSVGFIIEEGLDYEVLRRIVESISVTAGQAGVKIVTGDTKVVPHGKCDKVYINTTGIGELDAKFKEISSGYLIRIGDKILVNGYIAEHGAAIISARNELKVQADIYSDCAALNHLIQEALIVGPNMHFMRDATRGGLATVLAEMVRDKSFGVSLDEIKIPIQKKVRGLCEFFGFDPLYLANEGKVVMVCPSDEAEPVLETLRKNRLGEKAQIIGEVVDQPFGKAVMQTQIGGKRILDMLTDDQLPRIC